VAASHPVVFQNVHSGHGNAARLHERIAGGLAARGLGVDFFVRGDGESLHGAIVSAATRAAECGAPLVAVGGDGTVNLVARAALEHGLALGIVPTGTYNFVARSHGVPETLDGALDLIASGTAHPIRIGRLNERRFLVNASIGLYARLLSERETLTRRLGRRRAVAMLAAALSALRSHRPLELSIRHHGVTRRAVATTFIVGNNAFQLELVGVADVPADGVDELAAVLLHPVGRATLLAMILRGQRGEVRATPELESFLFDTMDIDVPRRRARRISVALDGEIVRETLPLAFSVEPRPLLLLRPPRADELAGGLSGAPSGEAPGRATIGAASGGTAGRTAGGDAT